ncbi:DUF6279 family lipoprotein [Aquabacterium parvum]|jgi:hypothetical protein|uniref:DUF6279 family lipoprotein n=1 Tax=Aquabacterium parvum TaxID=70584 RepID=UPI000718E2C0|nr:DUF6279 family lipoprotein [Aquabacterium parvum]MBU0916498.1 hypothetical protein [Gammaproteobacteria bacterium]
MKRALDEDTPRPWLERSARWAVIGVCALLVCACSILQAVYEQAPRYLQWRTNVAHHFTEAQYELARTSIRRWFEWHRREQMPQLARLLQQAALDVRGPITPELACERRDAYLAMSKQAFAVATPLAAAVMVHLGPPQVSRVQAFFEDLNEDQREKYIADDPREQAGLAVDFIEEWGGLVYGDFSDAQREHLVRRVMALPFSARTVLQELQRFQGRYVQLLRDTQAQKLSTEQVSQRLLAILLDGVDPQEPDRKAQMQRWVRAGCAFAADLQAQTTPAQRERAERTLTGWREDVQEIVGQR